MWGTITKQIRIWKTLFHVFYLIISTFNFNLGTLLSFRPISSFIQVGFVSIFFFKFIFSKTYVIIFLSFYQHKLYKGIKTSVKWQSLKHRCLYFSDVGVSIFFISTSSFRLYLRSRYLWRNLKLHINHRRVYREECVWRYFKA